MAAKSTDWAPIVALGIGLSAVNIAAMGYLTFTLNKRIDSVERSLNERMDRLEGKVDALDAKFDKLLIALAGRGLTVPAKVGKNLHSKGAD